MYHLIFQVVLLLLNLMKGRCLFIRYLNEDNSQEYYFYYFDNLSTKTMDTEEADVVETEIYGNKVYTVEKHNEITSFNVQKHASKALSKEALFHWKKLTKFWKA